MSKQSKGTTPTAPLAEDRPTTPDLVGCPGCGSTAEVIDRFPVESTAGPVEHVRISCLYGHHHFTMPAPGGQVPAATETATETATERRRQS